MSLSLHSSMECGGSMSRGSRNSSDIVSLKSRMGLISSRISSRPDSEPGSADARHSSAPMSHLKEAVCSARRSGTSSGSVMRAKEIRRGASEDVAGADGVVRDAAKWGPSEARWLTRTPSDPPLTVCTGQRGEQVGGQRKRAVYTQDRLLSRWPERAGRRCCHCWRQG